MNIEGYEDFSLVGAGGNAHVYSAHRSKTGEVVAIKILRGGGDPGVSRRFARERDAMDTLEFLDHVAPILESGTTSGGDPYLIMPLFDGGSLQQRIAGGAVPWREALALVRKVTSAVAQAHERRILHLDIKPGNVLLDSSGEPFLSDFGIAETMGTTSSMSAQMLTPAYTPPERLNGAKPSEQTDIYGLGALLFALVAGEAPFVLEAGVTPAAMFVAVLNNDVSTDTLVERAPAVVVNLIANTLSKSIDDRPASALALCDRIDEILADESLLAFDPVLGFRVGSSGPEQGTMGGEGVVGSGSHEIVGQPGTGLESNGELISFATPLSRRQEEDDDRLFAIWVAAAILFICVGVAGALTASAWNGRDSVDSTGSESLALDEISQDAAQGEVATVGASGELTSSPATQQPQAGAVDDVTATDDGLAGDENGSSSEAGSPADDDSTSATGAASVIVAGSGESRLDDTDLIGDSADLIGASADPTGASAGPIAVTAPVRQNNGDATGVDGASATNGDAPSVVVDSASEEDARVAPTTTTATPRTTAAPAPTTTAPPRTTAAPRTTVTTAPPRTTAAPRTTAPPRTTTTTAAPRTTVTTQAPVVNEPLQFQDRIDIGSLGSTEVRFRFTTSENTGYTATIRSGGGVVSTRSGTASAGRLESVTVGGLTPGTDYTVQVTLNASPSVSSTPVAFRTSGGTPTPTVERVAVQNLRLASTGSTRFQVNYESNVCANGSFTIREAGGTVVGSNSGQANGCTTRHLAVPGFWTPALSPNTTYVITVTVEANGRGQGGGNTHSQSLTVTTAG